MIEGRWFYYTDKLEDMLLVRNSVMPNLKIPIEVDFYSYIIVIYEDNTPVATGSLIKDKDFKINYILTLENKRGLGYGDLALRLLIRKAFDMGGKSISLIGQEENYSYFEKIGFKTYKISNGSYYMKKDEDIGCSCKG